MLCSYHFPSWIFPVDTELLKFSEERILPDSILHSIFKLEQNLKRALCASCSLFTKHCFPSPALTFLLSLTCATIQKSFFQRHMRLKSAGLECALPSEGLLCYRGGICNLSVDTYRERIYNCIMHLCLFLWATRGIMR